MEFVDEYNFHLHPEFDPLFDIFDIFEEAYCWILEYLKKMITREIDMAPANLELNYHRIFWSKTCKLLSDRSTPYIEGMKNCKQGTKYIFVKIYFKSYKVWLLGTPK